MTEQPPSARPVLFRQGEERDAAALVTLLDMASDGEMARDLASQAAAHETWRDVGLRFVLDPLNSSHFRKAIVAECDGEIAGALFTIYLEPDPDQDLSAYSEFAQSLFRLRNRAPRSLYLRNMAVFPRYRGQRIAQRMLDLAFDFAKRSGLPAVTAIVHDRNIKLLDHYYKRGMRVISQEPAVPLDPSKAGTDYLLLSYEFPSPQSANQG